MFTQHEVNESSALGVTPTNESTINADQTAQVSGIEPSAEESAISADGLPAGDSLSEFAAASPASDSPKSILETFDDKDYPFRIEKALLNIWGQPEHKDRLKSLIKANGWTKEPISVASVKGMDTKPFLFDGMTRMTIWLERKAEGIEEPLPEIRTVNFETFADALKAVIEIQNGRRNSNPAQIAYAAMLAMKADGFDISPKTQGRQPKNCKAKQIALKPLPSAKELAEKIGVSDPIIRVVQKAMKYPELISQLVSKDPANQITTTQAQNRMEGYRRDIDVHNRQKTLAKRRAKLAKMKVESVPDIIGPSRIYTGDSVELLNRVEPYTVSLALTSIPYPCNVEYDVAKPFNGDYSAYLEQYVRQPLTQIKKTLVSGGRVAINFDNTYRSIEKQSAKDRHLVPNQYNMIKDIGKIAEDELGLLLVGYRVWYKQNCPNYFSHGSRDCRTPVDNPNTEFVYIFAKDSVHLPCAETESDITTKEYDQFAVTHWYISPQTRKKTETKDGEINPAYHICPYPEELCYRLIRMYCPTSGIVLDPYSGSGTTCFVAKALGRPFIGIDNSELYNQEARKRLATLDGLTAQQRFASITRFIPDERVDGLVKHNTSKAIKSKGSNPADGNAVPPETDLAA